MPVSLEQVDKHAGNRKHVETAEPVRRLLLRNLAPEQMASLAATVWAAEAE